MSDPPAFNFRGGARAPRECSAKTLMRHLANLEQARREDRIAQALWQINYDAAQRFKARER